MNERDRLIELLENGFFEALSKIKDEDKDKDKEESDKDKDKDKTDSAKPADSLDTR